MYVCIWGWLVCCDPKLPNPNCCRCSLRRYIYIYIYIYIFSIYHPGYRIIFGTRAQISPMPRILPTLPCSRSHKFSRCRPIPDARPSLAPPHDPSSLQTVLRLPNIASVLSPSVVQASGRPHRLQQTVFAASSSRESVGGRCLRASWVRGVVRASAEGASEHRESVGGRCLRASLRHPFIRRRKVVASPGRDRASERRESWVVSSRVRAGPADRASERRESAASGWSPRASGRVRASTRRASVASGRSPRASERARASARRASGQLRCFERRASERSSSEPSVSGRPLPVHRPGRLHRPRRPLPVVVPGPSVLLHHLGWTRPAPQVPSTPYSYISL